MVLERNANMPKQQQQQRYVLCDKLAHIAHMRWLEWFNTVQCMTVIQKIVKNVQFSSQNAHIGWKWNENKFAPVEFQIKAEKRMRRVSLHLLHSSATHFHLIGNIISTNQQLNVPLEINKKNEVAATFNERLLWEKCLLHVFFFFLISRLVVFDLACKWIVQSIMHDWHISMQVPFVDLIKAKQCNAMRFNQIESSNSLPISLLNVAARCCRCFYAKVNKQHDWSTKCDRERSVAATTLSVFLYPNICAI